MKSAMDEVMQQRKKFAQGEKEYLGDDYQFSTLCRKILYVLRYLICKTGFSILNSLKY